MIPKSYELENLCVVPVYRQDLNVIVSSASKPVEKILRKLDRGTRETIKHLVSIFAFGET